MSNLTTMNAQLDRLQTRQKELLEEKEGLEGFENRVRAEQADFAEKLARKRAVASKVGAVADAKIAIGLSSYLSSRLNGSFTGAVQGSYAGVRSEIRSAINEIESELAQIRLQVASTERSIDKEKARIRQELEDAMG